MKILKNKFYINFNSIDAMVRKNAYDWFRDFRYQSHMTANSLWERLTRRRFRNRVDRDRFLSVADAGKRGSKEKIAKRERLDCCKSHL